jgi:hypothetical protein
MLNKFEIIYIVKNVIIASANRNTDTFLSEHWLPSLQDNVPLSTIDIVVLNYGMRPKVVHKLSKEGVILVDCVSNGHVANLRLKDVAEFLSKNKTKYNQVLFIDGGDVIFQADITPAFEEHKQSIRIAHQNMTITDLYVYSHSSFTDKDYEKIKVTTVGKVVLNAGVIFGPLSKMISLFKEAYVLIVDKAKFLPDQMAINYILHRDGYKTLDTLYNFMNSFYKINTVNKRGILYFPDGKIIPIVHNNGGIDMNRPFMNFGYGAGRNQTKWLVSIISRLIVDLRKFFYKKAK